MSGMHTAEPPTAGGAQIQSQRAAGGRGGLAASIARGLVKRALGGLRSGTITISERGRREAFGKPGDLSASLEVHEPSFWSAAAFGGSVGAGESYMRGDWSCNDLTSLCRMFIRDRHVFSSLDGAWTGLIKPVRRVAHAISRNTRSGSKRNISRHYDLSNEFFSLWLDPTMMYSCALFEEEDGRPVPPRDLERAQFLRLERICKVLKLSPADHLLEIGTGWGGMAMHAASRFGCRVTTTTISKEQARMARERVAAAGLSGLVTVIEEDYRDLRGSYDALVSLEMIEAVGHQYQDRYFASCAGLLRAGAPFLLQSIVIADEHYEEALGFVDFIKKHVFPGSFMPARSPIRASASRAGLREADTLEIGPHYATTLAEWRRRFVEHEAQVRAMGFGDEFLRMWTFYLCYCEAGFAERHLGDVQFLFVKDRT